MRLLVFGTTLVSALLMTTLPLQAETLAELSALSDRSADEQSGIALAQDQAGQGALLAAIATLERTLAANPKSESARLLHAFYLCKVDDRTGGAVEIGKLKVKKHMKQDLAQVRAACGLPAKD